MVYIPPPHLASTSRTSYAEAYAKILTAHRRSPLTSASSVIILVALDVDALCAARMMADLFKQDDVMHRIVPICSAEDLMITRNELMAYVELHTLILLNIGSFLEIPAFDWFGSFRKELIVHIIDSARPHNLSNIFLWGENGERIIVWDDGGVEDMEEERKIFEALGLEPEADSDEESEYDSEYDNHEDGDEDEGDGHNGTSPSMKRRSLGDHDQVARKKQRIENEPSQRMSYAQRMEYNRRLDKYYQAGSWYGQSASGTIYILATALERVDNELLWLAILGLTYQYTTSKISRSIYEKYHSIYYDEVFRLNPPPPDTNATNPVLHPDDLNVLATEEYRFLLFRHWTLYDAMYHSSYVASKLGTWKERGRKRLTGLLAKMGFSIPQTQQPYTHMDMDLKRQLRSKLEAIAPEYGLVELSYPSFIRTYGYRLQPLSAADAVEAISALLDVAGGVRMEVEVEGARNGGEWFGSGRAWEGVRSKREEVSSSVDKDLKVRSIRNEDSEQVSGVEDKADKGKHGLSWWCSNFWTAYDALSDVTPLREALSLSMSLHRAIIRQGSSIIDKQDIKTMRSHRVVVISQGPDLALFSHPSVLSRLAMWLVDAFRDRVNGATAGRGRRKGLPFVVACLNEDADTYIVVGVTASLDYGDVRKNEFGILFLNAKDRCNARTQHISFDTNVLEVARQDLNKFLHALCEGPD